ncbi:MAG: hypothetical protein Q7T54_05975 [Candidatus Levybacteria bacterium]|nr:hypothetical protein [Candidatus Levybacteria bacterium]
MEENQNPTPPVSEIPNPAPTPPVIPDLIRDPESPNPTKPALKLSLKLVIGIILFLLIAGGAAAAGFYVYKQQSLKTAPKPTPSPVVQKQTPLPTQTSQEVETNYFSFTLPAKNIIYVQGYITIKGSMGTPGYETVNVNTYSPDELTGTNVFLRNWDKLVQTPIGTTIKTCDDTNPSLCEMTKAENINGQNGEFIQLRNERPWEAGANDRGEAYIAKYGNRYYTLGWNYDKNNFSNGALTRTNVLKILSTFKFTDTKQSSLENLIHFTLPTGWRSVYKDNLIEIVSSDWDVKNPSIWSPSKTGILITIDKNPSEPLETRDERYIRLGNEMNDNKTDHPRQNVTNLTIAGLPALSYDISFEGYEKTYNIWQNENIWNINISGNSVDAYQKLIDALLASITFNN